MRPPSDGAERRARDRWVPGDRQPPWLRAPRFRGVADADPRPGDDLRRRLVERSRLETNVRGVMRLTRLCLPHIRDGGHIVNLGSVAGRQPDENAAVYVTSKCAVRLT